MGVARPESTVVGTSKVARPAEAMQENRTKILVHIARDSW